MTPARSPKASKQTQACQAEQQLRALAQGRALEALVLERLELPEQVVEFNRFEELSKLYEIEQPFVARTQVELLFGVYDGRRLRPGLFESCEDDDDDDEQENQEPANGDRDQAQAQDLARECARPQQTLSLGPGGRLASTGGANCNSQSSSFSAAARRRSSFAAAKQLGQALAAGGAPGAKLERRRTARPPGGLSWCRALFARRHPLGCCLRPSDTSQELGLVSASTSVEGALGALAANPPAGSLVGAAHAALAADAQQQQRQHDQFEGAEAAALRREVVQVLAGSLAGSHANRPGAAQSLVNLNGSSLGPALALESAQMESTGGSVSVCLLDKRQLLGKSARHSRSSDTKRAACSGGGSSSKSFTSSSSWLARGARRGRAQAAPHLRHPGSEWARANAHLERLRERLRSSGLRALLKPKRAHTKQAQQQQQQQAQRRQQQLLARELERTGRKVSRKFWLELAHDPLLDAASAPPPPGQRAPSGGYGGALDTAEQAEQLVELVKGSLNQLIDAQLMLRNKLAGLDQQLGSSALVAQVRSAEYENLLRNNFNLLKIWQNLEELQPNGLVCFVCEPVKATLADLFHFNRRRLDWAPAHAFEGAQPNSNTTPASGGAQEAGRVLHFTSPLVSLDAGQVKRGFLQILEALNFLHGICKLIHRNVAPANILVCQNDNWKLSGLEFAVRFESTTISESASMMAHEFGAIRYTLGVTGATAGAGSGSSGGSGGGVGGGSSAGCGAQGSSTGALQPGGVGSGANSGAQLRRQRTLHETKCQEFAGSGARGARALLLQPQLDYLAPEIWRHARCSHKSDLFSLGLVLGQAYDLRRHRPPIDCRSQAANYEPQLKKLEERRKCQLVQLAPYEMRCVLTEMLESEPNLRPSANHVLQLLRRPVELCKSTEDSLRHLKSSLDYLDTRLGPLQSSAGGQTGGHAQQHELAADPLQQQQQQQQAQQAQQASGSGSNSSCANNASHPNNSNHNHTKGRARRRTTSYFRRVTSAAASCEPGRRQTQSLRLLNYFVRAVDAMASLGRQPAAAAHRLSGPESPSGLLGDAAHYQQRDQQAQAQLQQQQQHQPPQSQSLQSARRGSFNSQRLACEQTLEILRQVLRATGAQTASEPGGAASAAGVAATGCPADSRSLLLIVALHRRLLEQVGALRHELPPICRLIAPSSGGPNQPLDRSLASASHRTLADLEERLYLVVSRHSLARLGEALADPLLKLEEFLLVFELVSDLVGFVGQKCKQNYSQRGRQLLNELTPVTGCPSLSSSDDDDDDDETQQLQLQREAIASSLGQQQRAFGGSSLALAMQANSQQMAGSSPMKRLSQQERHANYDADFTQQQHLHAAGGSSARNSRNSSRNNSQSNLNSASRAGSRQLQQAPGVGSQGQLFQLPTSINIVAPSPMGSVRDVSRLTSRGDSPVDAKPFTASNAGAYGSASQPRPGSPMKRHSHQDILANAHQQQQQQQQQLLFQQQSALIDKTSQMSISASGRRSIANCLPASSQQQQQQQQQLANAGQPEDAKSHSELIDELLKTINDDSFNEFIDFNNKLSAAATGPAGPGPGQPPDQLLGQAGAELAGARSKSAASGEGRYSASTSPTNPASRRQSCSPGAAAVGRASPAPPRTLNLSSAAGSGRTMARGSICVSGTSGTGGGGGASQQASTFDNVIRRMSTNFVQNFSKMSGTGAGASEQFGQQQQQQSQQQQSQQAELSVQQLQLLQQQQQQPASLSSSATQLRREKSSNSTYAPNSLYVDNQVPARRHSDNTINVPRIQVALSSPSSSGSRANLNQRASVSASKLANKWKITAKTNQREASDKLSPNLGGALTYIRRHSSGNAQGGDKDGGKQHGDSAGSGQSNGLGAQLLNASPFKTKSSSNLGIDFLMSNRSMKRRYSAASMLGHQTQRKAEDLIDAGMKSVQNMFS